VADKFGILNFGSFWSSVCDIGPVVREDGSFGGTKRWLVGRVTQTEALYLLLPCEELVMISYLYQGWLGLTN
jgi:hypothetical protein